MEIRKSSRLYQNALTYANWSRNTIKMEYEPSLGRIITYSLLGTIMRSTEHPLRPWIVMILFFPVIIGIYLWFPLLVLFADTCFDGVESYLTVFIFWVLVIITTTCIFDLGSWYLRQCPRVELVDD